MLFRSATGALATWQLADTTIGGGGAIGDPGAGWTFEGTGDFNGDGPADLLFQNASGTLAIWEMNGTDHRRRRRIWRAGRHVQRRGDRRFQRRFKFRHPVSRREQQFCDLGVERDGHRRRRRRRLARRGLDIERNVGDFDGDGKSDILFENAAGAYATWTLNGATITGGATLGAPGAGFVFKGIGDFNGDGTSDVLFENANTGVYSIWDISATR